VKGNSTNRGLHIGGAEVNKFIARTASSPRGQGAKKT